MGTADDGSPHGTGPQPGVAHEQPTGEPRGTLQVYEIAEHPTVLKVAVLL